MTFYDPSILKVAAYVEDHLEEELTLQELARQADFSKFHFTRIFKALTRETLSEYIRKRRLTRAAADLVETDLPLIELALTYGYQSQEAFSRAFKQYFGLSPQRYRNQGIHYENLYKSSLNDVILQLKREPVRGGHRYEQSAGFWTAGRVLEGPVGNEQVSRLWNTFDQALAELPVSEFSGVTYGIECMGDHEQAGTRYMAAVQLEGAEADWKRWLPEDWSSMYMKPGCYIVFELDGLIENIPAAIEEIYRVRLPQLGVKPAEDYHFERYRNDFTANTALHTFDFCIPIKGETISCT
ncbi:helix-turn-helix domain-containing protein [Paenibacillus sp. JX-17]|uniref:Helix-turn-helix domain-containing protein n=1 Tax=Paenibacillus lacisoli TaxID=3064525 RepID=A0ABT9CDH0_9BACL|nr:helix-turn-helix domain-containing protein [Paenibacillus sp. JX-17]MDO7907322.1 helix-turn-helix domain-containing protein [Paenibacillus sp. JX-17]